MKRAAVVLVLLLVAGGAFCLYKRVRASNEEQAEDLEIVKVQRGTVRVTVSADGTLRPLTTVRVKSYAGGRIDVLAVDVGDFVKKGDLIAKIDPTDTRAAYEQALADLNAAKARLAQAEYEAKAQPKLIEAEIAQAQAGHDAALKDVERLEEATLPQARAQAKAALDKAEAAYQAALKDLEELQNATQPQARAQAKAALDKAKAGLEAALKDLEQLQKAAHPQALAQAKAALDKAKAAYEAATKDLQQLEQATHPQALAQAKATLDKARADLKIAEKELERAKGLKAAGYIPQSELDSAQTRYEQAKAELEAAQERWDTIAAQQEMELAAARARVEQAKAELTSAQQRWNTIAAEQRIALEAAQARVEQARAELRSAQERWNTLEAEQKAQLEAAQARVEQAKADLEAARKRWETIEAEQRTDLEAAQARGVQAQASLERALANKIQERVREAELAAARAQVARAQAQVENAKTMLEYTTIRAPRDGVILKKFVEEGTIITSGRSAIAQGTDIVELGDLSKMYVDVNLDEADVAKVHVGQSVEIIVEGLPDKMFTGKVTRVNPEATTEQNIATVLVTVEIDNPDPLLKPGMTATCDFLVAEAEDTLYLPSRAVREVSGQYMVTVREGEELVEIPIEVGLVGDERTEILQGLKEGDEVVVPSLTQQRPSAAEFLRERGRRASGMGGLLRRR